MKKFSSGFLSLVVALALLEILSRALVTIRIDQLASDNKEEPWYVYSPELGWERKPGFNGTYAGIPRHFNSEGYLFGDDEKLTDNSTKKILFIGDSNTFGNDSPIEKAFPSLVDSALTNAVTVNLSVPGYTSFQGKLQLKRALSRFRPDVIVVSFNFNDRRYVLHENDIDGAAMFRRTYEQAQWAERMALLEKSYLVRAVRAALRRVGVVKGTIHQPVMVNDLVPRVSPFVYEENLTEIATTARQEDIPLIFLLLRDNPQQVEYLHEGIALLERAQPDSAIHVLESASRAKTLFVSLARLYLKAAYEQVGEPNKAHEAAVIQTPQSSLHGGHPIRLDKQYNEIMIRVAKQCGVTVVDGAAELEKTPFVYYDFCHFDTTGHKKIAEVLLPHLQSLLAQNAKGGL